MIITKLIGGLGNQLFQYALGRNLAQRHETKLKIDISGFEEYKLHKYSLFPFNIIEDIATPKEIAQLRDNNTSFITKFIDKVTAIPSRPPSIIKERFFHFDPDILNQPDNVYIDGYWQCEKYFLEIEDIIRKEVTVKNPQAAKDKEIADLIGSCESVSIHVRRGDYVSNENTHQVHGTAGVNYYLNAINNMTESLMDPHFFIFSDDPEWARDNLNLHYPTTIVDQNKADKNYEDLRLMSQCKHNIIANSTFSWWGAWLNPNPDKIVIAPERWFQTKEYDTRDLIPENWMRL